MTPTMTITFRHAALLAAVLMLCTGAVPAGAQEEGGAEYAPASHTTVVTSLKKCLDQLDPADAAAVRANFQRPYQECQARLVATQHKKVTDEKAEEKAEAEKPAQSPRNFVRVQQDKAPRRTPVIGANTEPAEPVEKLPQRQQQNYNR